MMPLHSPAPRIFPRLTEDTHVIHLRIAQWRTRLPLLENGEDALEAHYAHRFGISAVRKPRGEQTVREEPLLLGHFLDRQTLPRTRDEVPVRALLAGKIHRRLRLLLGGKRGEKSLRRLLHLGGG